MLTYPCIAFILFYLAQTTCSFRHGGMYTRLIGRGFDGDPPTNSLSAITGGAGNERISLKLGDFVANSTNFLLVANQTSNASISSFIDQSLSYLQHSRMHIEKQISLWWEMISMGRKGLLLILAPTIASQFRMLQTTVPFCIDHIMQYLHPLNIGLLVTLSQSKGVSVVRNILLGIIAMGFWQMLKDSFFSGASWLPARPLDDSYALVTGASSGLGKSMAYQLFETGYNVILVGRNETVLEDVRQEFYADMKKLKTKALKPSSPNVDVESVALPSSDMEIVSTGESNLTSWEFIHPRSIEVITTNLAHPLSPFEILRELKLRGLENKIDILVANAGRGHYGKMHKTSWSDLREQLEVNVASTVSLIRLMIPRMILRRHQLRFENNNLNNNCQNNNLLDERYTGGRILVISSVAGEGPGADIATYSAAKAFLSTFALSIRRELFPEGIMVSVAKPGPLKGTKFLSKVPNMEHTPMAYNIPFFVMRADDAAKQIVKAMILGREIVCPGFFTKVQVHIISKLLPASLYAASVQRFWRSFPARKNSSHLLPTPTPEHSKSTDKVFFKTHSSKSSQCQQQRNHSHRWPSFSNFKVSLKQWYETFISGDLTMGSEIHKSEKSESFNKQQKIFHKTFQIERAHNSNEANEDSVKDNEEYNLHQAEEDAEVSAMRKFLLSLDYPSTETQRNIIKDRDFSPQEAVHSPSLNTPFVKC